MRRVFHLLPEGEAFSEFRGGAISRWVANVLREDRAGVVIAPDSDDSWQYPDGGVMVLPWLRAYRGLQMLTGHRTPWTLRKPILQTGFRAMVKKLRAGDVLWVHNRPEFAAALSDMVHRMGATLVLHMHNAHLATANPRIVQDLQADRLVFVSRYLRDASTPALKSQPPSEVLYNGADGTLFKPRRPDRTSAPGPMRVLFASRLVEEKGPHILAKALWELHRRRVAVEGVIVGGAQFGNATASEYMLELQRNAPPNLKFEPYCAGERLARLFHSADVFCLPSVWHDPFPLAPLEAMAAGLPVVATYSGGIPEALSDGGGILIERNSVGALADALAALASNPALRSRLSQEASSSFLRNFRWSDVRVGYTNILGRLEHA